MAEIEVQAMVHRSQRDNVGLWERENFTNSLTVVHAAGTIASSEAASLRPRGVGAN